MNVVMLLYPGLTQLDLTGPFEVFARVAQWRPVLVWKTREPVADANGLALLPTATFADCPQADILFVPGGPGQLGLMEDSDTLEFLKRQAAGAQYITSVCTGSLVLGAAGLLQGYRATCHWLSLPQLALLGAEPIAQRVVHDRNRITGAGVTSGIDFALSVVAEVSSQDRAERIQLSMEYDPQPPFSSGSPKQASATLVTQVREAAAEFQGRRLAVAQRVGKNLKVMSD